MMYKVYSQDGTYFGTFEADSKEEVFAQLVDLGGGPAEDVDGNALEGGIDDWEFVGLDTRETSV